MYPCITSSGVHAGYAPTNLKSQLLEAEAKRSQIETPLGNLATLRAWPVGTVENKRLEK